MASAFAIIQNWRCTGVYVSAAGTMFDVSVGYENYSSNGLDTSHWYVSAGVRRKTGVVRLSLEGHHGRLEGEVERSEALGAQYDLAHDMSVNLGVIEAIDPEERELASNLRPVSYRGRQLESGKGADPDRP